MELNGTQVDHIFFFHSSVPHDLTPSLLAPGLQLTMERMKMERYIVISPSNSSELAAGTVCLFLNMHTVTRWSAYS